MKITRKLKDSGALLEISVLDHIIVAHDVFIPLLMKSPCDFLVPGNRDFFCSFYLQQNQ
ncbi:MAG: hypothetical protein NT004_03015 [Bacteroidetes bacterium]|nr:hypothetical protein [Bacteroidota bacterium]